MLEFMVPPGIGDFSAMYQKLCKLDREMIIRPSLDEPQRIGPFLDILPKVKNGGYSAHGAMASVLSTLPPGTDLRELPDGGYFLAINSWLEEGGKVADWIPGETDYHYEFNLAERHKIAAEGFREMWTKEPTVGIYCSAYGNSRHWGFWGVEEWRVFLNLLTKTLPKLTNYIFIGAEYDVQIAEYLYGWMMAEGYCAFNTLGAFHIGTTIEVIRSLDYLFSFPSGLGFLADVVRTPYLMWLPKHLEKMPGTFSDPEQFASGQSLHKIFTTPALAFEEFCQSGLKHLEVRYARNNHQ